MEWGIWSVIIWIVVGAIAGGIASWIMKAQTGLLVDIILGVVGALLGGWLLKLLGYDAPAGALNWLSFLAAIVGAIIVIAVARLIRR